MTAIFAECDRVLRDDGVMTVMFTHKRAEAWDTLGMALMEAGFTIETSWPVNTESEHSPPPGEEELSGLDHHARMPQARISRAWSIGRLLRGSGG